LPRVTPGATQNSGGSFDHASSLSTSVSASRIAGSRFPAGVSSKRIGLSLLSLASSPGLDRANPDPSSSTGNSISIAVPRYAAVEN
jgi:hypothetical protein